MEVAGNFVESDLSGRVGQDPNQRRLGIQKEVKEKVEEAMKQNYCLSWSRNMNIWG